ncbi:hypothetical protein GWQ43_05640 [Alcaligenes faecalis]|uniref:hypothetical protein n=1 Tax=Alcaligenes faecalis TaxID=511 RepID=UPI00137BA445|nr:hypothetical protein [Alcaligenes faecalis]QHS35590.1 hypothetical protein GWQ43_05640 [Alcaligenes faecalis]
MESNPAPNGARTKLDLLYHEVLGEVTSLVDRLEHTTQHLHTVQKHMQAMADTQQVLPQQLSRHLTTTIESSIRPIHQDAQQATQAMLHNTHRQLDSLAHEAARYATTAHRSARRMTWIALFVGGAAGVLGGLLAGLALGHLLIS